MKKLFILTLVLLNSNLIARATDNVAVFKNGTAFFIKKINLETRNNTSTINEVPDALFGTIWFSSPDNTIKSVISETKQSSSKVKAGNISEIISANTGKNAKITFHSGEVLQAKIEKIENELLFLRIKDGFLSISTTSVKMIEFPGEPDYEFSKNESKKVIRLVFAKSSGKQEVDMMYMQKDIGWVPSYFIDLINNDKAKIVLTANVMNDIEDLADTNLQLVVGVPNFAYSYLKSPLTSTQLIGDFLRTLENQSADRSYINSRRLENIMTQSSMPYEPADNYTDQSDNLSQQEDFYFYKVPRISLKKSERAIFELFKSIVNYEHIYEVELESNQKKNQYVTRENDTPNLPKVWHSIRLDNSTGYPFTTGTAMVVKSEEGIMKPVSQDKLNYTPVKGKTKLKLTVSPDISVKESEKETSRSENIKLGDGYYYDQLDIESKISIKNNKNNNIRLNINRVIEGKLINSSRKWNTTALNVYKTENPVNKAEWDLDLKPGESAEIIYKYTNFIRR